MAQELRQTQKLEQGLVLTPQLKRSLEILQAPALDIATIITEELRTNPLLEENFDEAQIPQNPVESDLDSPQSEKKNELRAENKFESNPIQAERDQAKRDFFLNSIPDTISLQEYLLNEASIDTPNEDVARAFKELAGLLDDRGFLPSDAMQTLRELGCKDDDAQLALQLLRECEPSGIGAFDMRDSLILQLEHKDMLDSLPHRLLENHYQLLMKRKVAEIAKLENTDEHSIELAIAEIAKLSTSPAHEFEPEEENYISADLDFIRDEDGAMRVELTNENIPKLKINPEYRQMAVSGKLKSEEENYIREKIRDAKFIMDALKQRQSTLLKIGLAILAKQGDFFSQGPQALHPMTMQDLADAVDLHASTVGRAVSGKYAQTPFGLFPLKSFFSGAYESDDGSSTSSSSVKDKIKEIIAGESPKKPLSDGKIADILLSEGINIARRTVAKYREELEIPTKSLRKRF